VDAAGRAFGEQPAGMVVMVLPFSAATAQSAVAAAFCCYLLFYRRTASADFCTSH
jgi:hypothetical protein